MDRASERGSKTHVLQHREQRMSIAYLHVSAQVLVVLKDVGADGHIGIASW